MRQRRNLAASLGRWSAGHRLAAIFIWIAFVVVAVGIGTASGQVKITDQENRNGQSATADGILDKANFKRPSAEGIIVQSPATGATGTTGVNDPNVHAAVTDIISTLKSVQSKGAPAAFDIQSPFDATNVGQISSDGRSVLVQFDIQGDPKDASGKVGDILKAVDGVKTRNPQVTINEFGDASFNKLANDETGGGSQNAEMIAGVLTLIILLVAFGAVISALLPFVLSISSIVAATGLVDIGSHIVHVNQTATVIMALVGMAVGVDYSMFYIRRMLEERARGRSKAQALEVAAATSGRSVLISGLTVVAAMGGMFFAKNATFSGIALATILVVLSSVVASVTVLPALLALLGDKVDRPRIPFLHRLRRPTEGSRFWGWIIGKVLKRPLVALGLGAVFLLGLCVPAFSMHTANAGVTDIPKSVPVMKTYSEYQKAFPGGPGPAEVVVKANDVNSADVQAAIGRLKSEALATGVMHEPVSVKINPTHDVAVVDIAMDGTGTDSVSENALHKLRNEVIPSAFGDLRTSGAVQVAVTGEAAGGFDFNDQLIAAAPIVFAFVLTLAFILLLVSFRSIVVAIKAIILNLMSVGAAYGFLVLVFQHHWADSLLGYESNGAIVAWLPLFLFTLLFGLSMDYHVLVLSRIREAFDKGRSTPDAVSYGIRSTAGVITSAAVIMVAVFATFATMPSVSMKEAGLGLAFAVLIDATVIRAVMLPAAMTLLGDRNWYLPKWLGWLPKMSHGEEYDDMPAVPAPGAEGGEPVYAGGGRHAR